MKKVPAFYDNCKNSSPQNEGKESSDKKFVRVEGTTRHFFLFVEESLTIMQKIMNLLHEPQKLN